MGICNYHETQQKSREKKLQKKKKMQEYQNPEQNLR